MKKLTLGAIAMLFLLTSYAQKDLPDFGTIDKGDLLLKKCDFDPDAAAFRLIDYGNISYQYDAAGFKLVEVYRERIKILKDQGLDEANVKLRYVNRDQLERINKISAVTYNLDDAGNVVTTKVEKSAIYEKQIDKNMAEISFSFPNVKVGSVIEYTFTESNRDIADLPDWYFQGEYPIRISEYTIEIPSIFRFFSQALVYQNMETSQQDLNETIPLAGGVANFTALEKTFILRNTHSVNEEPFCGAIKDYMQRVEFQLNQIVYSSGEVENVMSTWPKLTKDLLESEDYGHQFRKRLSGTSQLEDSVDHMKSEYDKMAAIYSFVQKNMNWNEDEELYSQKGIKDAWDKKSGSNSEINMILLDLLRDADLKAYPILVSTRDHGAVNTLYPLLEQFNNTMVMVEISGKRYILDASDKYNPANLIPYDVLNNPAYVVDEAHGGWIQLDDESHKYQNSVYIFGEITPDGILRGNTEVTSSGYSKNPRVKKWLEDKSDFGDYFTKTYTGLKIDSLEVDEATTDTLPMIQKMNFTMPVNASGDYEYFPLNLFQGLEKNPFIADQRYTDIDFGYKQSYMITGKIYIPDGYAFETLPKNIKMIIPDTSIMMTRLMQADDNSLDFMISVNFLKPSYSVNDYAMVKQFYKKLFDALNEQVVIHKKKAKS